MVSTESRWPENGGPLAEIIGSERYDHLMGPSQAGSKTAPGSCHQGDRPARRHRGGAPSNGRDLGPQVADFLESMAWNAYAGSASGDVRWR